MESAEYEFEQLVEEYMTDVRKIIFVYVKNKQAMEDVAQEVFLSVYRNLNQFRRESSIKSWIMKIAVNKSKDYLKSWHYRKVSLSGFFKEEPSRDDTEHKAISNFQNQELAEVIMNLPIKYREIIILYYYEDMDTAQISDILNVNVNTVKTRLIRGRELIKRRFEFNG
ncbi:RNA polymerase sigma (SigV) subunit [Cytobacillus firmus]|uniref:RNA polymerase sigma (SigV) subunit n=2 Tax=Cytobacillus TaxID=2675230 RepID=A0A366JJP0_CYTFI|nr:MULTISPECIES: sigma-70 family RNA polymerase sigma factor [Cytobacillus]RBP86577.1 RNA polymerase sigma (SigV) subunit [Cytobacillus firmus]TDX39318.1 RNA polymerase sigma (SigV) subunit [Cytobacillus oceanisediminis]